MELFERAQSQRSKIREERGIGPDELLLIYAGGGSKYQMIPQMLRIWAELQELDGIHFLVLLSEQPVGGGGPALDEVRFANPLDIRSVSRDEAISLMAAADVGFMLRQENQVNRVASPIKFGEYLASGLGIVTSPGVGDVSRIVEEQGLGILVRPDDTEAAAEACREFLQALKADRKGFRDRARNAVFANGLDWAAHIAVWKQTLGIGENASPRREAGGHPNL